MAEWLARARSSQVDSSSDSSKGSKTGPVGAVGEESGNGRLGRIAEVSATNPGKTLAAFIIIAVIFLIPASQLQTDTSVEGVFGDDPGVRELQTVTNLFGEQEPVTVVVDCSESSGDVAKAFLADISSMLEDVGWFRDIAYFTSLDFAGDKAILYVPTEHLYFLLDPDATPLSMQSIHAQIKWKMAEPVYFASESGELFLLNMKLGVQLTDANTRNRVFDHLNAVIEETISSRPEYADLEVGFTGGMSVRDYDGDKMAMGDLFMTVGLTFVLILILLFVSFRALSIPILSLVPIVLGIMITAGLTYVLFGALGIVTMVFAVLLLGLGIDFCVHILVRFMDEMDKSPGVVEAIRRTYARTGKAVILGCLTTATAFGALALSRTEAMFQMGIVSATGLLVTLVCVFFTLPALISLRLRSGKLRAKIQRRRSGFSMLGSIGRVSSRYALVLIVILVVTVGFFAWRVPKARLSTDIHELQPESTQSYRQLEKVKASFDYSEDVLLCVVDDYDELVRTVEGFSQVPEVLEVESVLNLLPEDQESKLQIIEQAKVMHPAAAQISWLNTGPMKWEDLPEGMVENWVSVNSSANFLITIRAKGNLYDNEYRDDLVESLREVNTNVLGYAILWPKLLDAMIDDVVRVTILAAVPILLMVYFGFSKLNPVHTALAMVPVVIGIGGILALYDYVGVTLNMVSVLMIPLVVGIGIDSGIHIMHRYHEEGKGSISRVVQRTGRAVFLTTATTCLAFGSLMFAGHPGIMSLGRVPVLGLSLGFLASIFFLPSLMKVVLERRVKEEDESQELMGHGGTGNASV